MRLALLALLLASGPALSETVTGQARVIDGDTVEIAGTTVRLLGIDAPESGQSCKAADGKSYLCGTAATDRLRALAAGKPVECTGAERDAYGRLLGTCRVGGVEINRTLVREGLAWAFVRYSRDYVSEEGEARAAKRGVFAAENEPPWQFRAARFQNAPLAPDAPEGCPIKGNISRKGEKIYHMPWQLDYGRTRIDVKQGERWFCDEGEAEKAGWRKAMR